MIESIKYLPPLGKSDHLIKHFNLITYANRFQNPVGLFQAIRRDLNRVKWEEKFQATTNVQESWKCFTDIINDDVKKNVPVRKAFKYDTPWMNRYSRKTIRK